MQLLVTLLLFSLHFVTFSLNSLHWILRWRSHLSGIWRWFVNQTNRSVCCCPGSDGGINCNHQTMTVCVRVVLSWTWWLKWLQIHFNQVQSSRKCGSVWFISFVFCCRMFNSLLSVLLLLCFSVLPCRIWQPVSYQHCVSVCVCAAAAHVPSSSRQHTPSCSVVSGHRHTLSVSVTHRAVQYEEIT